MSRAWLIIWAIAVAAVAAGCGGDDDSTVFVPTHDEHVSKPPLPGRNIPDGPTTIDLHPVRSSAASGTIAYEKQPSGKALLRIRAEGLEPLSPPARYVVWQFSSRYDMAIVSWTSPGSDGTISESVESLIFLDLLEREVKAQILVTRVDGKRLKRELARAKDPFYPGFVGEPVLRGSFVRLLDEGPGEG